METTKKATPKKATNVKFYLTEQDYRKMKNIIDLSKYRCIKGQANQTFCNMYAFFEKH